MLHWLRSLLAPAAPGAAQGGHITRQHIMHLAFEFVAKSDLDGCYVEFGCYRGDSFIRAYHAYQHWLARAADHGWAMKPHPMVAFDSFEGLPPLNDRSDQLDQYQVFKQGQYACSEPRFREHLAAHHVDTSMVRTVVGYYDQSLAPGREDSRLDQPVMIAHIDCDLYASAVDVLNYLQPRLQDGALLLFDDYLCFRGRPDRGVRAAFEQWLSRTGIGATEHLRYSWAGRSFIVHLD